VPMAVQRLVEGIPPAGSCDEVRGGHCMHGWP
jgi:hypothetical protein